jgi:hypothetical protein
VDGLAANPFGENYLPWWRKLHRSSKGRAPKRYAAAAGAVGSISGLVLHHGDGLDRPTRLAIFAVLSVIPPFLVERWWRERERRQEERLLVLPE